MTPDCGSSIASSIVGSPSATQAIVTTVSPGCRGRGLAMLERPAERELDGLVQVGEIDVDAGFVAAIDLDDQSRTIGRRSDEQQRERERGQHGCRLSPRSSFEMNPPTRSLPGSRRSPCR